MIACVTTGASADSCTYNGREGDTHLHLWPLLFPFRYLGYTVLQPEIFHGVGGVAFVEGHEDGLNAMQTYFNEWRVTLASLGERPVVPYNSDTEFDDSKKLIEGAPVHSPFIRHQREL